MQLIAGRTAQEYHRRKNRHGAFWEARYHATAIRADDHLHQCVVYIDLDMVRAGVVKHPREWENSGYREIQKPPSRYGIIDLLELNALFVGGERMASVVVVPSEYHRMSFPKRTHQDEEIIDVLEGSLE
jgi:hypothetical protein